MAMTTQRPERREQPLSRDQIVRAAVELLDDSGENGLTFRTLAGRLATGPGAIYWHISGKGELLGAAAEAVIAGVIPAAGAGDGRQQTPQKAPRETPQNAVRALALGLFDAIEVHPWLGTQLVVNPRQSPMLRIFETIGRQVRALGVPLPAEFTAASALLNYILGVAGQNAAAGHAVGPEVRRAGGPAPGPVPPGVRAAELPPRRGRADRRGRPRGRARREAVGVPRRRGGGVGPPRPGRVPVPAPRGRPAPRPGR